jgi:DNA-binding NarL/FixJ family response regulator
MSAPTTSELVLVRVIRVLLVDDHMLVRAGLRAVLNFMPDMEIVGEAASGEEAIALVARCHPDVVIMDLDMPGDGGLAATRALTAVESHPSILVLTMHPEAEGVIDALRAGAVGYLTKNLAQDELATAIRVAAAGEIYVRPHVGRLLAATLRRSTTPVVADPARLKYEGLSAREQAVLLLVAEGNTGPEIGRSLGIAAKTVDTYRHRIQEKIGLAHRRDYIRFALNLGILKN